MIIEEKLKELGIELYDPPAPLANYISINQAGDLLFVAGTGPVSDNEIDYKGVLGKDLTIEQGYQAAKLTAINIISILKKHLGDLDRVKKILKVTGFVASANDFYDQPAVINGASDLFVSVFGNEGKHARAALGTNVLPFNMSVEIMAVVQIHE